MQTVPLSAHQLITLQADDSLKAAIYLEGRWVHRELLPYSIYVFVQHGGATQFLSVDLPGAVEARRLRGPAGGSQSAEQGRAALAVVPVMILVDDDEPAARPVWEKRLRERVRDASAIFEYFARIRFDVVAAGTWESDNRLTRFDQTLAEFERKVDPHPARLALGFTSQYRIPQGRVHLGGTRGPLHSHILVREWSQHVSSRERLEILVHELGHFLGAVHATEADSVMRPVLGDRRSNWRQFEIKFDPINAFCLFIVGEEMRRGKAMSFDRISPESKAWLRAAYRSVVDGSDDNTAVYYLTLLDGAPPAPPSVPAGWIRDAAVVRRAVLEAARRNAELPLREGLAPGIDCCATDDRLGELLVRRAASAAKELPQERAARALCLGLGAAAMDERWQRFAPAMARIAAQIEESAAGQGRGTGGAPTAFGREDYWTQFFVGAMIACLVGPETAEAVCIGKQSADLRAGGRFRFGDLAVALAGIRFAQTVRQDRQALSEISVRFRWAEWLAPFDWPIEELNEPAFQARYGSTNDARFHRAMGTIREWVERHGGTAGAVQAGKK